MSELNIQNHTEEKELLRKFQEKIIEIAEVYPDNAERQNDHIRLGIWLDLKVKNPNEDFEFITEEYHK